MMKTNKDLALERLKGMYSVADTEYVLTNSEGDETILNEVVRLVLEKVARGEPNVDAHAKKVLAALTKKA
jgi:hypothetical protein